MNHRHRPNVPDQSGGIATLKMSDSGTGLAAGPNVPDQSGGIATSRVTLVSGQKKVGSERR